MGTALVRLRGRSPGFTPSRESTVELPPHLADLADACRTYYDELVGRRLAAGS